MDYELESGDAEVLENVPSRKKYDRVQVKKELEEPIEEAQFSERCEQFEEEVTTERKLIENATLVLKEELNVEEWIEFEKTKAEVYNAVEEDLEHLNKVKVMDEPSRVPVGYSESEDLVVDEDPENLELYEFIEMDEDCSEQKIQKYRKKREKYPCSRRKKKRRRSNAKQEAPKTL